MSLTKLVPGVNCGFDEPGFWETLERESRRKITHDHFSDENFKDEYLKSLQSVTVDYNIKQNSIVNGKIKSISEKELVVDINYKDYIYVDIKNTLDLKLIENFKINDSIDVVIVNVQDDLFTIEGSVSELLRRSVEENLKKSSLENIALSGKVINLIPTTYMIELLVDNLKVTTFMPNT